MDEDGLVGRTAQRSYVVGAPDLAGALGSGDVPVLATPRLIAWLEAATVDAVGGALPAGATTVGTSIEVDHIAASPEGAPVTVSATVHGREGRVLRFDCEAAQVQADGSTTIIAHGSIARAIVDRDRFLARLRPGS
jgi:fluoroacetyl-CoA thioesterase